MNKITNSTNSVARNYNGDRLVWPIEDPINDVKAILSWGLGEIPYIGSFLSMLLGLLWPKSQEDVWNEILKKLEKLIDEKIDEAVYSLIKSKLPGLEEAQALYLQMVKTGDKQVISEQFIASNTVITAASSVFQNPDYEWLLLPLFGIFTHIHISLLREGVIYGKGWGWSEEVHKEYVTLTTTTIAQYINYLDAVAERQETKLKASAPTSPGQHMTDITNYWNKFGTLKTFYVNDVSEILKFMDPTIYPKPVSKKDMDFDDVYTPAVGTADDFDDRCRSMAGWANMPYSKPLSTISEIYIEYFNKSPRVLNTYYKDGIGPRVWNQKDTRSNPVSIISDGASGVEKETFTLPSPTANETFPLVAVEVKAASIPATIILHTSSGQGITLCDRPYLDWGWTTYAVEGRRLTTFNMWTLSRFYDDVLGCVFFGFSVDPLLAPPKVIILSFITAVNDGILSSPVFKKLPKSTQREIKVERKNFWEHIMNFGNGAKSIDLLMF